MKPRVREVTVPKVWVVFHDRTQLADRLKAWVGKRTSTMGVPHFKLRDGLVTEGKLDRPDILLLQQMQKVNVFVDWDGRVSLEPHEGVTLTDTEKDYYRALARLVFEEHHEFVKGQRKWHREKPWQECYGLTPEQAIETLTRLGWPPSEEED